MDWIIQCLSRKPRSQNQGTEESCRLVPSWLIPRTFHPPRTISHNSIQYPSRIEVLYHYAEYSLDTIVGIDTRLPAEVEIFDIFLVLPTSAPRSIDEEGIWPSMAQ
ncbi:hypothetical protein ABZX51_011093 [Aspergillus tubingensis]